MEGVGGEGRGMHGYVEGASYEHSLENRKSPEHRAPPRPSAAPQPICEVIGFEYDNWFVFLRMTALTLSNNGGLVLCRMGKGYQS